MPESATTSAPRTAWHLRRWSERISRVSFGRIRPRYRRPSLGRSFTRVCRGDSTPVAPPRRASRSPDRSSPEERGFSSPKKEEGERGHRKHEGRRQRTGLVSGHLAFAASRLPVNPPPPLMGVL